MKPSGKQSGRLFVIAGATGYLGGFTAREALRQGFSVRLLARRPEALSELRAAGAEVVRAEATRPETLAGCFTGAEAAFSSIGITRQTDGLRYRDVDYGANRNLLEAALAAGVKRFVYVSVFGAEFLRGVRIIEAKERFVRELRASDLEACVIRPTGFFSDYREFQEMARRGRIYLIGDGAQKSNPIHGADLAEVCLDALRGTPAELSERPASQALPIAGEIAAGGPEILTQNEIADLARQAIPKSANRTVKRSHIPLAITRAIRRVAGWLPERWGGSVEFFLAAAERDLIAPPYGRRRLGEFYHDCTLGDEP